MGAAEEGGARQGVCVREEVVVGHGVGARMGDTNGYVPSFWSSAIFASATLNCLESVTF